MMKSSYSLEFQKFGLNTTKRQNFILKITLFSVQTLPRVQKGRGRLCGGVAMYIRDDLACSSEIIFKHITNAVQIMCVYIPKRKI